MKYTQEQTKASGCINQFMENNRARQTPHMQHALTKNPNTGITVVHDNVQGPNPHKKDVDGHTTLIAVYIICMSETHLQKRSPWPLQICCSYQLSH